MYQHKPVKIGAGIGIFAALFILLTTALLVIVPQELMSSASTAYLETWTQPITAIGGFVFAVGIPLACAAVAYYLTRNDHTPKQVVIGFLVGGLVFVVGNAILGVAVTNLFAYGDGLEQSLLGHMQNSLPHGLRLSAGGLVGVVGALVIEEYL